MPNTKITKQKFKDHLPYAGKLYIFGFIIAIAVASLMFTVTRHVPDDEFSVEIALVDNYVDIEKLDADCDVLLDYGRQIDPTLEQVTFFSIAYSENASNDESGYYGAQLYQLQIMAGTNDIYVQSEVLTRGLVEMGGCVPLEETDWYAEFTKKHPDVAFLWADEPGSGEIEIDEDGNEIVIEAPVQHAYAVDVSSLTGFIERQAYDIRGKYACMFGGSKNMATSYEILTKLFDVFAPAPAEVQG